MTTNGYRRCNESRSLLSWNYIVAESTPVYDQGALEPCKPTHTEGPPWAIRKPKIGYACSATGGACSGTGYKAMDVQGVGVDRVQHAGAYPTFSI